jgi:hypothetical protein
VLVDAQLAAGDVDGGAAAAGRLAEVASSVANELFAVMAAGATGRVAMGRGDPPATAPTAPRRSNAFVTTEVESTPLLERISDDVYRRIRADAHMVLAPFTTPDGHVEAPFECNVVAARRP